MHPTNLSRTTATALSALGLLAALAGCGSSSQSTSAKSAGVNPLGNIRNAADVTQAAPGFKLALTESVQFSGASMKTQGSGYFSFPGPRGKLTLQVNNAAVEEILLYPNSYLHVQGHSFNGKPWASLNLAKALQTFGLGGSSSGGVDPAEEIGFLRAAGTVSKLGSEAVRGTPTTRYAVTLELKRLAAAAPAAQKSSAEKNAKLLERLTGSGTLSAEAWLDAQGRLRRERLSPSICTPVGRIKPQIEVELYDFGAQPAVSAPAASETSSLNTSSNAGLEAALAQLHC